MKKVWWIVIIIIAIAAISYLVLMFTRCTYIAQICPDGTIASKNLLFCSEHCPEKIYCGIENECPTGMGCYLLPGGEKAYCILEEGEYACAVCRGKECSIQESYPARVVCG
jgi:hypothetical protein